MSEPFVWPVRVSGLREQLPSEVAEAIETVGTQLTADADIQSVIAALRAHGLGFLNCIAGLIAITGVSLADAKWLVHDSPALADGRHEREAGWAAMYDELAGTTTAPACSGPEVSTGA